LGVHGGKVKVFFFEKKKQKTFTYGARLAGSARQGTKVFCFFFSKKKQTMSDCSARLCDNRTHVMAHAG